MKDNSEALSDLNAIGVDLIEKCKTLNEEDSERVYQIIRSIARVN